MEKAYVITGLITLTSFTVFIWYIRLTKRDNKLKIVHRS